jgi:uncharacterized protein YhaN
MRIRRLDLKAFGPFSNRQLDFSTECPGLHIVYGPNEAGKSSCLRALKALFFGIPTRTSDSFLHPYDQLMVGGCLRGEDGRELAFYRRKKRKADLFDQNDDPLDPARLAPFLQGVEPELFESLYGIDHEALVRGGQEILNQKGDVGQAIFAAGAGLTSLKGVLDELEKEGDDLFRPRGSTMAINEALSHYRDLQGQVKLALLSSQVWQEHRRELQRAEKDQKEADALRREKDREKRRLERLRRALPHLSQRRILLEKLANLGEVVLLPAGFSETRRQLEKERNDTARDADAATSRLQDLEKRREGVSPQQALIHRAAEIEELYQRLGEYRKAMADRPRLEGTRISHKSDAAALMKQIRPDLTLDQADTLRPGLAKKRMIQNLGNQYGALVESIGRTEGEIRKHKEALDKSREALSQLPPAGDSHALVQVLKTVQKAGDLDKDLRERGRALEISKETCQKALTQLGLWSGPVDQVGSLAIPMPETVNRFEESLDSITEKRRQIQGEMEKLDAESRQLLTQFHEIQYGGEVPTEEELLKVRSSRDLGWGLLKRQWLDGEEVAEEAEGFSPDSPLPEAYENLVGLSDQTADRLRREADRVQKHASLKSRIEGIEDHQTGLKREMEQLDSDLVDADCRWHKLWSARDIDPLSPREMTKWLSGFEKLRFRVEEAERAASEMAQKEIQRQELRGALIAEMRKIGDSRDFSGHEIAPVLMHAEMLAENIKSTQTKREKLEAKIEDLEKSSKTAGNEKKNAEESLKKWRDSWKEALAPLGLDAGRQPEEAIEYIEILQSCFEKLKDADDLTKRIDGIDRDNKEFRKEIEHLVAQVALDLKDAEIVQAVSDLQARLNAARQDQAVLHQYLKETDTLEKKFLQAQTTLDNNKKRMASLLQTARCKKEEEMDEAEQRCSEYLRLKEKLSEVESALAQTAEGVSFADLENQASNVDPDTLPGQIETLSHEIEHRLDPEIRRLSETIGKEKTEMARMDGGGRAAELADASQQVLAKVRRLTERFIRVKLATKILRDVIESYRAEHQDPVLKIASRYFRDLTLGSFIALRTDVDDHGQAILIGVRPDGSRIHVEGMSNGTRDQLYLALRLATLEWRLESSEPMPFIVDDILINFDDDRSRATLKAMAELAEKNQVILFTHHQRIVETARTVEADQRVFIHEI